MDIERITSTDAKNHFGRILDRVNRGTAFVVTKHDRPAAAILSMERYRALTGEPEPDLDTLAERFDALFEAMQAPGARGAMRRAFEMSPEELGRAAVEAAREDRDE